MFATMAAAAPDVCDAGECTLTLGGDPTNTGYLGFRPFVTDWWGLQPVNVENQAGDVLGTYPVGEVDFQSPIFDTSYYFYHAFTPADASITGDPYGLSGAALYDVGYLPWFAGANGAVDAAGNTVWLDSLTALAHGSYFWVVSLPGGFQNTLEISLKLADLFGSSDYMTFGGGEPFMLWDTLPEVGYTDVAAMLPPDELITWP